MRSARSPFAFSNAAAIAGHTWSFAIRFACTEYWRPTCCPASGMHLSPVCAATLPCASTIATCRTLPALSALTSVSSACGALMPCRMSARPLGP